MKFQHKAPWRSRKPRRRNGSRQAAAPRRQDHHDRRSGRCWRFGFRHWRQNIALWALSIQPNDAGAPRASPPTRQEKVNPSQSALPKAETWRPGGKAHGEGERADKRRDATSEQRRAGRAERRRNHRRASGRNARKLETRSCCAGRPSTEAKRALHPKSVSRETRLSMAMRLRQRRLCRRRLRAPLRNPPRLQSRTRIQMRSLWRRKDRVSRSGPNKSKTPLSPNAEQSIPARTPNPSIKPTTGTPAIKPLGSPTASPPF